MTTRYEALRLAVEVLVRSDWLMTDLLADEGVEDASEEADRALDLLREMRDEHRKHEVGFAPEKDWADLDEECRWDGIQ